MSENANIERIHFEQIQEFKDLDLYALSPGENPEEMILLVYDPVVRKFIPAILDTNPNSGGVIVNNQAKLLRDVVVQTDDLPLPSGYIFKKDIEFTEFVEILCNPKVGPVIVLTATPALIEVNQATNVTLVYAYTQNDGGVLDVPTLQYFRETVATTSGEATTIITESTVNYSVFIDMIASDDFGAENLTDTDTIRAVYPNFINTSSDGNAPGTLTNPRLADIKTDGSLICELNEVSSDFTYYYFAVHTSNNPTDWVEIDENEVEDFLNGGPIETAFTNVGSVTFKNNSYSIWMSAKTTWGKRIKIKF